MDILEMLEEVGLPRKEAEVYLALVKTGGSGASQVASLARMHRPNVYDILQRLGDKGLVASFTLNGKTAYTARKIGGLRDFLEEKMDCLDALSAELERYGQEGKECEVSVFSGRRVVRVVTADILATHGRGDESLIFGVDEKSWMDADIVAMGRFFERMRKRGMKEKVLVAEGSSYFPAPRETTRYATLPKKYLDPATTTTVYGDKVALLVFSEPNHLIIIKNKKVAESYRRKFRLLWKVASKIRR